MDVFIITILYTTVLLAHGNAIDSVSQRGLGRVMSPIWVGLEKAPNPQTIEWAEEGPITQLATHLTMGQQGALCGSGGLQGRFLMHPPTRPYGLGNCRLPAH